MKPWAKYPVIYEINTWVWLGDLSRKYQQPVNPRYRHRCHPRAPRRNGLRSTGTHPQSLTPTWPNPCRRFSLIRPSTGSRHAREITPLPTRPFELGKKALCRKLGSAMTPCPWAASSTLGFRASIL